MHPNGQIPAYEFAFGDVNPPVHAWACWRVYKMTGTRGHRDRVFLRRAFHKLLDQFHLVGQSQGSARPESVLRRLSGPRQHRRVRSLAAAAQRPATRTGRRHRLDGVLLCHDAVDGLGVGRRRSVLRRHRLEVLRALCLHHRRDEFARRHGAVGRAGRLLLRRAQRRRQRRCRCGFARWSASSRCLPSKSSSRT